MNPKEINRILGPILIVGLLVSTALLERSPIGGYLFVILILVTVFFYLPVEDLYA